MASCNDCIHVVVCDKQKVANHNVSKSVCKHFKAHSSFAEWVEDKTGFHCSHCRKKPGVHPVKRGAFLSRFCPHCGFQMKEEG